MDVAWSHRCEPENNGTVDVVDGVVSFTVKPRWYGNDRLTGIEVDIILSSYLSSSGVLVSASGPGFERFGRVGPGETTVHIPLNTSPVPIEVSIFYGQQYCSVAHPHVVLHGMWYAKGAPPDREDTDIPDLSNNSDIPDLSNNSDIPDLSNSEIEMMPLLPRHPTTLRRRRFGILGK